MTTNISQNNQKRYIKQRVKNYDAGDISKSTSTNNKMGQNTQKSGANGNKNSQMQASTKTTSNPTFWTKFLVVLTYIMGLSSVLFFLSSAWLFLGTISLVFSLAIFLLAKQKLTKLESGKVFFVSLCAAVVSVLFWVLFLTTRRYGIGFLSSLFRAIQIAGAFVSAALILYYFLEYVSGGKIRIKWISNITEKTEAKFSKSASAK